MLRAGAPQPKGDASTSRKPGTILTEAL